VDISLERPAKLRLIVRDESGGAVPGARAMLFQGKSPIESAERVVGAGGVGVKMENPVSRSGIMSLSDAAARANGFNTPVPDSGEVVWHRKEPGEWTLWVTAAGYYKYQQKLTLLPGKELIQEAVLEHIAEGADPRKPPKHHKNQGQDDSSGGETPPAADGGGNDGR